MSLLDSVLNYTACHWRGRRWANFSASVRRSRLGDSRTYLVRAPPRGRLGRFWNRARGGIPQTLRRFVIWEFSSEGEAGEDGNEEPLRVCLYPFWDESGAQPNCRLIWERDCVLIKDFTPNLGKNLCPAEKLEREGPPLRPHWNSFSFFMRNIFILHVSFKSIQELLAMIIKVFFKRKKILHLKASCLFF